MDDSLISFYAEGLEVNLFPPGERRFPDSDYHALQNAALLRRIAPDHEALKTLYSWSDEDKASLVIGACGFVLGFTIKPRVERIYSHDEMTDDDLDELESMVWRRDELEATLRFASDLVREQITSDEALRKALIEARSVASDIDEVLCKRPDALSVVARSLELRNDSLPWLAKMKELDRLLDSATLENSNG